MKPIHGFAGHRHNAVQLEHTGSYTGWYVDVIESYYSLVTIMYNVGGGMATATAEALGDSILLQMRLHKWHSVLRNQP